MMAKGIARGVIAAVAMMAATATVQAGERSDYNSSRHERHRVTTAQAERQARNRDYTSNDTGRSDLPSSIRGVGTYAGGISALRVKGNGIYFHVDGKSRQQEPVILAPKAKIIEVSETFESKAFLPRFGCAMEMGVCVVRGDR